MGDTYPFDIGFTKNTRDEVINLRGELRSPAVHSSSPVTVTNTRAALTLTSGKRHMRVTNIGTTDCYYGGVTVTKDNGDVLFSNGESIFFENLKDSFAVYFITAAGTTELRVVEF